MPRWINRAALVVRPAKPFLDWASGLDDEASEHSKILAKRVSIYLVAEDPNQEEETAPVERYFKKIFETELSAWSIEKSDWPKDRTLQTFLQWFDVAQESVVTDLETGPIKHDAA